MATRCNVDDLLQMFITYILQLNLIGCQFGDGEDKGKLSVCRRFDTAHRLRCTQQGIPRKASGAKASIGNYNSNAITSYNNINNDRSKDSATHSSSSNSPCATKDTEL